MNLKVVLCDVSENALENGRNIISKSLSRSTKRKFPESNGVDSLKKREGFISHILSSIVCTTDAVAAASEADLVIEAIVENMDIKRQLFDKVEKAAKKECILVSNTSSLSISEICSKLTADGRKRFGGLHFFNPVPAMKLVEVIRASETSDETIATLFEFSKRLGKVPVACKDTPGFIVNRLLIPYMREAFLMYERGDATAEDIDTAMRLGAGYPMGPLELTDLVGLDTAKAIGDGWRQRAEAGDEHLSKDFSRPIRLMDKLVSEGKLGVKTGQGIYKY